MLSESKGIRACLLEFKPVLYRRYVDECFLLFKYQSHVSNFFDNFNGKHNRIKFTFELEQNNCLSFLDVLVNKSDESFSTDTYRKPTFTGLGMKFHSFRFHILKINLIHCLIERAYNISSSFLALHKI